MNTKKTLIFIVIACLFIAVGIYLCAYTKGHDVAFTPQNMLPGSHGKVMTSTEEDGTYTVRVRSITSTSEDTTITFDHVSYFEGDEAKASAKKEVRCEDKPLEACVPTLTRGYYVRESGADSFTAPVNKNTKVSLKTKAEASPEDLRTLVRTFDPVFEVVITDGNIVSIIEKSPL